MEDLINRYLQKVTWPIAIYTNEEILYEIQRSNQKGKGMRTLFRKAGFQIFGRCSKCEVGICKKTMVRENPTPFRSSNVLVHGLICCNNGCG